jgi:serpin B
VSPPSVDAGAVEALVAGNNQFALSLLGQVGAGAQSNVFLSPYSASAALGMTYAGARDQTATAMMQTLDFPTDGTSLAPAFGSIDCQLVADGTGPDGGQLDLANKLFGQQGFIFQPDFISLLHDNYGSDLQLVDFANDPTAARETINGWVSQQTLGNIPNLLSLDEITSDDVLVLVDAIYFKGAWRTLFDQAQPGNFQVSSQSSVSVPMMYANDYPAPFYQGSNFEVLELPTKGSQIAVDLILPDDVDGLAALESSLTPSSLESTLGSLQPTLVNAYLPKFKLDTSIDLVQTLTDMGMGVAFTGGADFSGIGGTPGQLQILHVQHEAVLDFDEGGIAASGATAVVVGSSGSSGGPPASTFYATHPFLIVIRDVNNGSILFMGQVVDPSHT